jgi:uncharacterized protein DUF3386
VVTATVNEERADALVRGAHARVYRYPDTFEGFEARLTWRTDQSSGAGTVVARRGPAVDVADDASAELDWVTKELRSIVGHRQFNEYDAGDGRHDKSLGSAHVLGEVVELGDSMDSSYRVDSGEISTVTRTMGGRRFTIVIHDRRSFEDGRTLPTTFSVFYWDAETGALTATEAYRDEVAEVGGIQLPALRRVVRADADGLSVRELALSEHALLGAVAP